MLNQDFVIVSFHQGEPLDAVRKFLEKFWKDITVITPTYSEEIKEADRWYQIWLDLAKNESKKQLKTRMIVLGEGHDCKQDVKKLY